MGWLPKYKKGDILSKHIDSHYWGVESYTCKIKIEKVSMTRRTYDVYFIEDNMHKGNTLTFKWHIVEKDGYTLSLSSTLNKL